MVDGLADGTLAQPSTGKGLTDLDIVARETVPLMSMFDNAILSRSTSDTAAQFTKGPCQLSSEATKISAEDVCQRCTHGGALPDTPPTAAQGNGADDKYHRARSALLLALPPLSTTLRSIHGKGRWWEQWQQKTFGTAKQTESFSQFADRVYRNGHPAKVGQLVIAYGMTTDASNLSRYLGVVQHWVISDDEYASSLEGIECMLLQGKCFADIGQPQRCWSAWRRAILYAELRGLHRNHSTTDYGDRIWWSLFLGDRFTSLLLGVPYGISDQFCDLRVREDTRGSYSTQQQLQVQIGLAIGRVIDNIHSATADAAPKAMILEHELEQIASLMPSSWWDLPSTLPNTDEAMTGVRLRLSLQLCFYHVKTYLHLPLMLRYPNDPPCEYSTKVCLRSARQMLHRFLLLRRRRLGAVLDECQTTDFIGFTAAIILILGLFGYNRDSHFRNGWQDSEDYQILRESLQVFKDNSMVQEGRVAARCFESLQLILGTVGSKSNPRANSERILKLSIPFFGHISVVRRNLRSDNRIDIQPALYTPCNDSPAGHQGSGQDGAHEGFMANNPGSALPCEDAFIEYSGLYGTNFGANDALQDSLLLDAYTSMPWQDTNEDWVLWDTTTGN
ncbi:hypothetical protein IFM46972_09768 [Aspergillus udagawae]|uniref:Xylanolytic transcriptional activator regulatory domain-containing protein n=1 Tax=Aspergillus udagawae TaxID=91492 RepID=A0A8H3XMY4_9EURO|nr:hypothetical protein IFM46972_09768 [Aspergillus udagawae]